MDTDWSSSDFLTAAAELARELYIITRKLSLTWSSTEGVQWAELVEQRAELKEVKAAASTENRGEKIN